VPPCFFPVSQGEILRRVTKHATIPLLALRSLLVSLSDIFLLGVVSIGPTRAPYLHPPPPLIGVALQDMWIISRLILAEMMVGSSRPKTTLSLLRLFSTQPPFL
jgi:hypothetical protein